MSSAKGSEWRKWDLHVHTPESIVHEYKVDSGENTWEKFIVELEKLPQDIKVIGINDYLFLDGYKKVKEYKTKGRLENIDLILPVIEFRLKEFVGHTRLGRINYHIIFSKELTIATIEQQFLNQLYGQAILVPNESTATWGGALSRQSLIDLGRKIKETTPNGANQPNGSDLEVGFNNINFELSKIKELLNNEYLQKNYLTAIGKIEWDDFRWNGSVADKKTLINGCDFVFIASPNCAQAIKSCEQLTKNIVNDKVLHSSDAHQYYDDKYTSKVLGNCFTWIKADTTFEGLKQVLYEPQRIRLSETNPNQKNSYQYIESIKLIDDGTLFGEQTIGLSPDLNSIIGGKSSGKSLLLYHIAKTVMTHEKFAQISSIEGFQKYENLPHFDIEAQWADGHISKLRGDEEKRPIVYIPQMYLNFMAEKKSRNEDFKQTINDILKTNNGYSKFIDSKQKEILEYEKNIDNSIKEYFVNINKLNILKQELKQLGDKNAIETNIQIINKNLESLRNTAGFTKDEVTLYETLNSNNKKFNECIIFLNKKKELLNGLTQNIDQIKDKIPTFIDEEFGELKFNYQNEELKAFISNTIQQINTKLQTSLEEYLTGNPFDITEIDAEIENINNKIIENNAQLEPLVEKIQNLNALKEKEEELSVEQNKIKEIELKIKEIDYQVEQVNIGSVIENYQNLFNCYSAIVEKNEEYKNISESIDLLSEISFNTDNFKRDFSDYITKNRTLDIIFDQYGFNGNDMNFNVDQHIENITYICNKLLSNTTEISFNKGKQTQEIISALFKNYFDTSYDLMQGDDRLGHMSPGKKGIILFQLFLHMSSSKNPILIDQPEDNLDNRTVYQELNDFIKEKKLQRQIIIISHNSNLVVSTDSENVIVAHQNPNGVSPKFKYINGSLENTFEDKTAEHILQQQGIREHVCEVLEGGVEAFKKRERKYNI